ncbi:MAG: PQQ-binding-like beta-propeller repeat protein [Planctomycetes bacterium]|nr:PQQ-binding-like beta-propeller repeat protein [Planctomycetota bacterium]
MLMPLPYRWSVFCLVLLFGVPNGAQAQEDTDPKPRPFQVYDTMEVRAIGDQARENLAAGRIPEALQLLQSLIEAHRGEVLPPEHPTPNGRLEGTVHRGASAWAFQQLFQLAPEQAQVYRRMYEGDAQAALERALEQESPTPWLEIARRWPITHAALRARWAVGDLAMEAGETREGLHAWGRALAAEAGRPDHPPVVADDWRALLEFLDQRLAAGTSSPELEARLPGIRYRVRLALDLGLDSEGVLRDYANGLQPGEFTTRSLDQHQLGWAEPARLPDHPLLTRFGYQLQAAADTENLFVSTSRQLLAFGLWSGETRWASPLSLPGWSEAQDRDGRFTEAIDYQGALYAPAVSDGIVVTSLQLPFVLIPPDHYRQIQIIRVMPERRLFAFEAATGKPLWNTAPPANWDGESGSTAERVSVAGPPVIAGTRVVVPTVHLRGRVEFHVDCFDLHTGEHLWHTPLVTGQRELNMFSREIAEFTAPPVRVVGDRVFVATSIGSVACLDLVRGDTLWQSLYEQIEISKATYYAPGQMRSLWIHSPPAVTEDLVVVAPTDSLSLLCFDRESGDFLWEMDHREFYGGPIGSASRPEFFYLVDANENQVILGGRRVAAFGPISGTLRQAPARQLQWAFPISDSISNPGLRAVAAGKSVLVPCDGELVRVERDSGRPTSALEWAGRKGSPLATEVGLFTVGRNEVRAYFDWKESLAQAQKSYDAHPEDPKALYRLALLRQKRGLAERAARPTPDLDAARRSFQSARELLRTALAKAADTKDGTQVDPGLRTLLFDTLLEEGRTLRMAAASDRARRAFEEALEVAQGDRETSSALLLLSAMDRGRDEVLRRQRLQRLATEFGGQKIACVAVEGPRSQESPPSQRYEPVLALTSDIESQPNSEPRMLPLGLWARMECTDSLLASAGRTPQASPFADLYTIVREYGSERWFEETAGQVATERIATFLDRKVTLGFEAIQQQAALELAVALDKGSDRELRGVQRLFPLTLAAEQAGEARVQMAAQAGDVGLLAEVVLGSGPMEFSLERSSPTHRAHLALLAATVGDAGGLTFRSELGKRIAASAPRQVVDLGRGEARTLEQWSLEWSAQVPVVPKAPEESFGPDLNVLDAASEIVPTFSLWVPPHLTAEGNPKVPGPVTLLPWRNAMGVITMAAFRESPRPVWALDQEVDIDSPELWAVSPGLVHAPQSDGVLTVDRENGEVVWMWYGDSQHRLIGLVQCQGVVVATLLHQGEEFEEFGDWLQVGLEASSGTELWRRRVSTRAYHPRALVGSGAMVLFSTGTHPSQIFDLFSGAAGPKLELDRLSEQTVSAAWIDRGRLILPAFARYPNTQDNHIEAYDLATGQRAWEVPFGANRDLWGVLLYAGKTYLEINTYRESELTSLGVFELDTERGSMAPNPKWELRDESRLIGLPKRATSELSSPWIFARTNRAEGYGIRALHLERGPMWEASVAPQIYFQRPETLLLPKVSRTAAVLALPRHGTGSQPDESTYYVLSFAKDSGRPQADLMVRLPVRGAQGSSWVSVGNWIGFGNQRGAQILGDRDQ